MSTEFFDAARGALSVLSTAEYCAPEMFTSIFEVDIGSSVLKTDPSTYGVGTAAGAIVCVRLTNSTQPCLNRTSGHYNDGLCPSLRQLYQSFVNEDASATWVLLGLQVALLDASSCG